MFPARVITVSETGQWLLYGNPLSVLVANHEDEVSSIIDEAEAMATDGCIAFGFVSYEAAPAFDPALKVLRGTLPLAAFAVFQAAQNMSPPPLANADALTISTQVLYSDYKRSFIAVREELAAGNSYQVNLTHPLKLSDTGDPLQLFAQMQAQQPTRFATYLELPEVTLCCVSPELFFRQAGGRIETEPMKGTRPRARDPEQDKALLAELQQSSKDRAENLMIVDMIRNDLGRIADPGSVKVDELFSIRQLPTVFQQVSKVSANSETSVSNIFRALFPCASVTGAPKANTMKIISTVEAHPRGVYTGAIGRIGPGRDAEFSVAIRTVTIATGQQNATYGIGGGVIWQSDVNEEWRESLEKSAVLTSRADFSLLETLLYTPGEGIVLLAEHMERLRRSCDYFDINCQELQIVNQLRDLAFDEPTRVRLLVSQAGDVRTEHSPLKQLSSPITLKLAAMAVRKSDIFLQHKTTRRDVYLQSRWGVSDCDDVILWNEDKHITETTIYNLFIKLGDDLVTPHTNCGLLPGTLRAHLLAEGKAKEAHIDVETLWQCDQIFVGNSVRGLLPAVLTPD